MIKTEIFVFLLAVISVLVCESNEENSCPVSIPPDSPLHRRCGNADNSTNGRVAIAFFGISRGLKHTLPSIQRHVFDVLHESGLAYDVFWHTVATSQIFNSHSNERGVEVDEYDAKLMRPCHVTIVDQSLVAAQEFDKYCRTKKLKCSKSKSFDLDPSYAKKYDLGLWSDSFSDTRNRLNSLYSQKEVLSMIREHSLQNDINYDGIIALRPDMAPITDIDIPLYISKLRETEYSNSIWIPDYQPFRGYNDRSAWGSFGGMTTYLSRGKEYRDKPQVPTLHSERFLKAYLDHKGVDVHESSTFRSVRIRADGCVDTMDTWHMNLKTPEDKEWLTTCFKEEQVVLPDGKSFKRCPRLVMGEQC